MNFCKKQEGIDIEMLFFIKAKNRINEHFASTKVNLSTEVANRILSSYYEDCENSCIRNRKHNFLNKPDLSIIIPTYNNANYIGRAVESVITQDTEFSFEIIIINDGSTDDTKLVLSRYNSNKNIIIINQDNKGFSGARNIGIDNANGKYIMFLDSDDYLAPDAIQNLLSVAMDYDADIVEGNYKTFDSNGNVNDVNKSCLKLTHVTSPSITLRGYPWGKVYKNHLLNSINFPLEYWFEDTVMPFIIFPNAKNCYLIPENVYMYFINPKGITSTFQMKPKSLDTLYITRQLLKDKMRLNQQFTEIDYWLFLNQIKMNYSRTRFLSSKVKKSIFVITCDLFQRYFEEYFNIESDSISEIFNSKKYKKYIEFCNDKYNGKYMLK